MNSLVEWSSRVLEGIQQFQSSQRIQVRCRVGIDGDEGERQGFRQETEGPVLMQYDAAETSAGGPNDRGDNLNSFEMVTDFATLPDLFPQLRNRPGTFVDCNLLRT